jgi:hypothetical protein
MKILTFGGARSHDISDGILDFDDPDLDDKIKWMNDNTNGWYRINHKSWWEREMPSIEEMEEGIKNLEKNNWRIDFIFTHCAPTGIQSIMGEGLYKPDNLADYLDDVSRKSDYKAWLFGHMHVNQRSSDKHYCLYEQITRIW